MSEEYIEEIRALHSQQTRGSYTRDCTVDGCAPNRDTVSNSFAGPLSRALSLRGRGNAPVRQAAIQSMQRIHGNRAVQRRTRGEYEPTLPFFLGGPVTWGYDYLLYSLGPFSMPPRPDALQPTVNELVQEHIATVQSKKAYIEAQQAKKHEQTINYAQRAITDRPPEWFFSGEFMNLLEMPEYRDVSPALRPWELRQFEEERETK